MAFRGYLVAKKNSSGTAVPFPHKYIVASSWKSTPNQREEIKAYRDDNTRNLYRYTASGRKSKFSFDVRAGLDLAAKQEIQKFFSDSYSVTAERKIFLYFWNDETNSYDSGYFYIPNIEFTIRTITDDNIYYDSFTLEFIEY